MSEDRLALLDRAQSGDKDACGKMLEENSGLIWAVVRRYYGCGAEPEDDQRVYHQHRSYASWQYKP